MGGKSTFDGVISPVDDLFDQWNLITATPMKNKPHLFTFHQSILNFSVDPRGLERNKSKELWEKDFLYNGFKIRIRKFVLFVCLFVCLLLSICDFVKKYLKKNVDNDF